MNIQFKKIGLVAAVATAPLLFVNANAEDQATANATADIIQAIAIAKDTDLAFGSIVASATDGTVVIDTGGNETCTNVDCVLSTRSAAQFTVTGADGYTYSITLPGDNDVTLSDAGATNSMSVHTFTVSESGTLTGGSETINVGATLAVGADQAAGSYSGQFDVIVDYN